MTRPELDSPDIDRLGALARRLRVAPRQLIVLAARCASGDGATGSDRRRMIEQARAPGATAHDVAALLLTPPTHFAQDELASAIASVFPLPTTTGE